MTDGELSEDEDNPFVEAAAEVNQRRENSRLPNWWFTVHHLALIFVLIPAALLLMFVNWVRQNMP